MSDVNTGLIDVFGGGRTPNNQTSQTPTPTAPAQNTAPPRGAAGLIDVFGGGQSTPTPRGPARTGAPPGGSQTPRFDQEGFNTEQAQLDEAFAKIQSNPEKPDMAAQDWRTIARQVVRVSFVGEAGGEEVDDETKKAADEFVKQYTQAYADQIEEHVDPDWWADNYEKPEEPAWWKKAVGAVAGAPVIGEVLEGMDWISQTSLKAADQWRVAQGEFYADVYETFGNEEKADRIRSGSATELTDLGEDGRINYREAVLGLDGDWGGRWGAVLDIVGTASLDPLSYTTLGSSTRAKSALASMEAGAARMGATQAGLNLSRKISRLGMKNLDDIDRMNARMWLGEGVDEALDVIKSGKGSFVDEVGAVNKQMTALERGGQNAVRLAGQKVLPTGRIMNEADNLALHLSRNSTKGPRPLVARAASHAVEMQTDEALQIAAKETDRLTKTAEQAAAKALEYPGLPPQYRIPAVKILNDLDEALPTLPVEVFAEVERGFLTFLSDNKVFNRVRRAINPRENLIDPHLRADKSAARALDNATVKAKALMDMRTFDAASGVTPAAKKAAAKELGGEEALNRLFNHALSDQESFEAVASQLARGGDAESAALTLLKDMGKSRNLIFEAAEHAGMGESIMREVMNYIPRMFTPKIQKHVKAAMKALPDQAARDEAVRAFEKMGLEVHPRSFAIKAVPADSRDIFDLASQSGATQARTLEPAMQDIFKVNAAAQRELKRAGIENFGDVFDTDIVGVISTRSHSAFMGSMLMDLTDELASISDVAGRRYAYRAKTKGDILRVESEMARDGVKSGDYAMTQLPNGGFIHINKPMHEELNNVRRFISNTSDLGTFQKNLSAVNSMWAAGATVFMPFNAAHHLRNATGNVFNSTLAGVTNPARFTRALKIQKSLSNVRKFVKDNGGTFNNAMKELGMADDMAAQLTLIRKQGIVGTNQVSDIFTGTGSQGPIASKLLGSPFVKTGRAIGEALENNARIAVFIDGIEKGMSPGAASANVRKYLFDYSDLTRFENDNLRSISRFYTFMRKNTALQAAAITQYPGRVVNAQRIAEAATDAFAGGEIPTPDGVVLPDWAAERNMKLREGGLLGDVFGDSANLVGVDTPLIAGAGSIGDFGAAISLIPGMEAILPASMSYGEDSDRFSRALSLFSGVPVSVADFLYGGRFDRDPFTGGPLEDGESGSVKRFMSIFLPQIDKGFSLKDKMVDNDTEEARKLSFLNYFTGLSTYDMTDDRQESGRNRIVFGVEESLQDLRKAHPELTDSLPTIDELRKAGLIRPQSTLLELMRYGADDFQERLAAEIPADARALMREIAPDFYWGPESVSEPDDYNATARNVAEAVRAIELTIGRELSDRELANVQLSITGGPTSAWEKEQGIEPYTTRNRYTPSQGGVSDEENLQRWNAVTGGNATPEEYATLIPLLTDIDRAYGEAQEAGLSDAEFAAWAVEDNLNRKEQANLPAPFFGTDPGAQFPLEMFRDGSLTADDIEKFHIRSWEQRAQASYYYNTFLGRPPTEQETITYVYQTLLTKTQQESLGLDKGVVVPSTENVQTEAEQRADAQTLFNIIQGGNTQQSPATTGGGAGPVGMFEAVFNQGG